MSKENKILTKILNKFGIKTRAQKLEEAQKKKEANQESYKKTSIVMYEGCLKRRKPFPCDDIAGAGKINAKEVEMIAKANKFDVYDNYLQYVEDQPNYEVYEDHYKALEKTFTTSNSGIVVDYGCGDMMVYNFKTKKMYLFRHDVPKFCSNLDGYTVESFVKLCRQRYTDGLEKA
jgi:hypothetical protein